MLVAGLLTPDQLAAIFLNVEELLENNATLAEKLRDALEIAIDQGDEDLLTVNIGSIFLDAVPMLHAFESYCTRQVRPRECKQLKRQDNLQAQILAGYPVLYFTKSIRNEN